MKIKNSVIINGVNPLKEIMDYPDVPIKVSFKLIKNAKKIDAVLESYNEANRKLLNKYVEKDENGEMKRDNDGNVQISTSCVNDYIRERNELLEVENDIDLEIIDAEELSIERIKPAILLALDYMIKI